MSHRPCLSIAFCLLVSSLLLSGQVRTPDGRDWEWLNDHRSEAFERLLPVEHDGSYVAYRLYRDLYRAPLDSLISRIELQRHQLTSATCGALRPSVEALSKVAISIPADTIVLHPFMHRIVLDLGGGRVDASLHDDDQPLVQWARRTADALSRCANGPK